MGDGPGFSYTILITGASTFRWRHLQGSMVGFGVKYFNSSTEHKNFPVSSTSADSQMKGNKLCATYSKCLFSKMSGVTNYVATENNSKL